MKYTFSSTGIDNFLSDYLLSAETICGNYKLASSVCHSLVWYVETDRAPLEFVKAMLRCAPKDLAKLALKGGSDDEILRRIKRFLQAYRAD